MDLAKAFDERFAGVRPGDIVNISDFWQTAVADTMKRAADAPGADYWREVYYNGGSVPIFSKMLGYPNLSATVMNDELAPPSLQVEHLRNVYIEVAGMAIPVGGRTFSSVKNTVFSGSKSGLEKFSKTYSSFDDYFLANNPQALLERKLQKFGLIKHLSGKEVRYFETTSTGRKPTGILAGVDPNNHNIIRVYPEGLKQSDLQFVETMLEEIHHSKTLGLNPHMRQSSFNETWKTVVEDRAKQFAKQKAPKYLKE